MASVQLVLELFPDTERMRTLPQLFLMSVYSYILYYASTAIAEGSEMLLSLYGPGIVGGLVIPILGAIPDCTMIFVAGIKGGTPAEIQQQLNVGVGTLAGSTIVLLTVPWAIAVFLGRRDIDPHTGEAAWVVVNGVRKPKYTKFSWVHSGVTTYSSVPQLVVVMLLTSLSYLIIQVPAFFFFRDPDHGVQNEQIYALIGFIVAGVNLFGYGFYQMNSAKNEENIKNRRLEAARNLWKAYLAKQLSFEHHIQHVFQLYDENNNGSLERSELFSALKHLGLSVSPSEVNRVINEYCEERGTAKDQGMTLAEFSTVVRRWMKEHARKHTIKLDGEEVIASESDNLLPPDSGRGEEDKERPSELPLVARLDADPDNRTEEARNDVQDEEPAEEEALTDAQLFHRAVAYILLAVLIVTVFSDPMVETITDFSKNLGIDPFYVSFLVTPAVSNASEVIGALIFARRKSGLGITVAHSSLYGAATMNNTLGLGVFLGLIYFRRLSWQFTVETMAILIVEVVVGCMALRPTIRMWKAAVVFMLFPFSLLFIFTLEKTSPNLARH